MAELKEFQSSCLICNRMVPLMNMVLLLARDKQHQNPNYHTLADVEKELHQIACVSRHRGTLQDKKAYSEKQLVV